MQEKIRLSQVLTLFYSRIPEKNFHFEMIYAYPFESIWFTFRDKVAPAKWTFGSLQVVIRVMNGKLQEAEESNQQATKQVLWLSYLCMTNDCRFEMIMTLFLGAEPFLLDDSQIETARRRSRRAGMSRAKYNRVKEESARNEGLYTPLTVGVLCPAELSF